MQFITLDEVIAIHDRMLQIAGGRQGVHDFTLLHSAVERPKAKFGRKYLYTTLWLMTGALLQSLVKNHPFEDGNKRTALTSTARFLYKNGYILELDKKEAVEFMVLVDIKNKTVEDISLWLKKHAKKVL